MSYLRQMIVITSIIIGLLSTGLGAGHMFTLRSQLDSKILEAVDAAEKELSSEMLKVTKTTKLRSRTAMELKPLYFHVDDFAVQASDMQLTCSEFTLEESNMDVLGHRMVPIVTFRWVEIYGKLKSGLKNNVSEKYEFSLVQDNLKGKGVISLTVDLVNVTWSYIYFRPNSSSFEIKSAENSAADPSIYKLLNSSEFGELLAKKLQRDISYQLTNLVTRSINEALKNNSKLKNFQPYSEEISAIGINNTENANMFIDNILKVGGAMIRQKFGDRIRIPDIDEEFSTKMLMTFRGSFRATDGSAIGTSSVYRTGDVVFGYDKESLLHFYGTLGFQALHLYYDRYKAEMWGVGPSGSLDTTLAPLTVLVHVHLNTSSKMIALEKFKIINVGLNYRITPEPTITAPDYDGLIFVSSQQPLNDSTIPQPIRDAISKAAKVNGALYKDGGVVEVEGIYAGRMVYAPVGPLSDYHDVRTYGEAAKKAVEKALKANIKAPLLVLHPDLNPKFPHAELVTLLGALEALYVNIQYREECPNKCPKVKNLGVWGPQYTTTVDIVNIAANLEDGRIVARDITDADPERMSPPRVEEYIREVFPPESGVNISVVSDPEELKREYPLFAAVNRAASSVERHAGRIIFLTYQSNTPVVDTVLLVGKGVTYDTGGADIKIQGLMSSMSRDKGGAAAVAGFMKVLSETRVGGLKVVAAMALTRNSIGENSFVADEVITARSGKRVRVVNTDAEGRMVIADVLCYMKELVEKGEAAENPHIISLATLTGHAVSSVGPGYSIVMNNGPAAKSEEGKVIKQFGEKIGEPLEISTLRKEDFEAYKGTAEGDDLVNSNKNSKDTGRGHQGPAAFLIMAAGLDKHELDSAVPIKFSHWDIAGAVGDLPAPATGAPVLALANRFIMRLEDPEEEGYH